MRRVRVLAATALTATLLAACVRPVDVDPTGTAAPDTTSSTPTSTSTSEHSSSSSSTTGPTLQETDLPDTLRVAISFDQPGVGLREGDTYSGLDTDVARYVARYLGISRITFVEGVTDQRQTLLATGQADLVLGAYTMTPERAEEVTFAGPYLTTGQGLLVRSGSRIRTPADLPGFTTCSVQGSRSTAELVDNHPGLHLTMRERLSDCVDLLEDNKVNAVTSDAAILRGYARASEAPDKLRTGGTTFTTEQWGVAMRREDTDLCQDVRAALADMVDTGAWKRSVRENLGPTKAIGKRTATPPQLKACPPPRPSSSSTSGSPSPSSS